MKIKDESLKNLVDEVTSEKIEYYYTLEKSLILIKLQESQEMTYNYYIAYLEKVTNEYQKYLSLTNQKRLFSNTLTVQTIPETIKPVPPVFSRQFEQNLGQWQRS